MEFQKKADSFSESPHYWVEISKITGLYHLLYDTHAFGHRLSVRSKCVIINSG